MVGSQVYSSQKKEDARSAPPSPFVALPNASERKPCMKYLDAWQVGDVWLSVRDGAVCPRCGFYANEHGLAPSPPVPETP